MASFPFSNICVVVDGSDASIEAARVAIGMAKAARAKLTAVAVIDTDTLKTLLSSNILVDEEMIELEADLAESNTRYLDRVAEIAHKARQEVETVLLQGSFHSAVLMEARSRQFDLIILGYSAAGATKRDLMSHERELIMNDSQQPILLVKAM